MRRRKEGPDVWCKRLKEAYSARANGATICEWCETNNVDRRQFYYWRQKLTPSGKGAQELSGDTGSIEDLPSKPSKPNPGVTFAEVHLEDMLVDEPFSSGLQAQFESSQIMIQAGGFQVFLGDHFSEKNLEKVMRVLSHV